MLSKKSPPFKKPANSSSNTSKYRNYSLSPPRTISTYMVSMPFKVDGFLGLKCNVILEGQDNIGKLYLGDLSAANDKTSLKAKGIDHVLTVAAGLNVKYLTGSIKHKIISAYDMENFNLSKYI